MGGGSSVSRAEADQEAEAQAEGNVYGTLGEYLVEMKSSGLNNAYAPLPC